MIRLTIFITIVAILASLIGLSLVYPNTTGGLIFSGFVMIVTTIKIFESFFTSHEKKAREYHGDWTLVFTSLLYLSAAIMITWEFFKFNRGFSLFSVITGLVLLLLAVLLRYWSIKCLGNQWAIHVSGPSTLPHETRLIIAGPYRHIRHPIYLSYILELLGFAILFSALYALIFVCLVNIPSYIVRSLYEEKEAVKRLGDGYVKYMAETYFMIPLIYKHP